MKWRRYIRYTLAAVCQYEAIAIATNPNRKPNRLPTITELNRRTRYHKVATVVLSGLAWHFFTEDWPMNEPPK